MWILGEWVSIVFSYCIYLASIADRARHMNGKEKTLVCKVGSLIRVFAIMLSQSVNNR